MTFLAIAALALAGATTWFAIAQPAPPHRALYHRLAGTGLALCLITGVALVVAVLV